VRRDLLYLGAVIANTALMVLFGSALLLAAIGPAWLLRRGSLRPLGTAPLGLIGLAIVVPLALTALGADCPVEGMDYLDQCNGRAQVGMLFLFGGVIALPVSAVAAVYAMLIRGALAVVHKRG
jgi:hypothetical protein